MGIQEPKVIVAMEVTKPVESLKSCTITKGYCFKVNTPFASSIDASSNLYHSTSGDQHLLEKAYEAPVESIAPYNKEKLDRSLNISRPMVPKGEKSSERKDTESARKRKESSVNEADGEDRLKKADDVASPRATDRVDDSLAGTNRNNIDFSAKRQRINPELLNGVAKNGNGLDDCGVNTSPVLRDSEADMVETRNLKLKPDPNGQSLHKKKEHHERKEKRKHSSEKAGKKLREKKDKERLRQIAHELSKENSELTDRLLSLSEQCQEINEANDLLMDELEKKYGPEAIADQRAANPASANLGSNSDGERTEIGNDSTADQERDAPTIKVE